MSPHTADFDVVIAGAGKAGLLLARQLRRQQPEEQLKRNASRGNALCVRYSKHFERDPTFHRNELYITVAWSP